MRKDSCLSVVGSSLAAGARRGFVRAVGLGLLLAGAGRSWAAPPVITLQPQSQAVATDTDVFFRVSADNPSTTTVTFQWRRNGVDIPGAARVYQGPSATDTQVVLRLQPADCGTYSVVVFNKEGAVSSADARLGVTNILVLPANDSFALRGGLANPAGGVGRGRNVGATTEPGEPGHGGKQGGASVWLKWNAPGPGIATFRSLGSGFDTTLSIYLGDSLTRLVALDGDDDAAGFLTSTVRFNAQTGAQYNIALDGFYGEQGDFILGWAFEPTTELVPVIATQPLSLTLPPGAVANFLVEVLPNGLPIQYQWFLNGSPIQQATQPTYVTPVNPNTVGQYQVRVRSGFLNFRETLSKAASLQLNFSPATAGGSNPRAAAMPKFREAIDPNAGPQAPIRLGGGPGDISTDAVAVGGFTGTQIFNTYGATKEPGEPNHCGEAGGASYWFAYLPPASGQLSLNTAGSTYDNVLATYTGPGDSFTNLVAGACSNTNGAAGGEAVVLPVVGGVTNYIVMDGVGGVTGIAYLNFGLAAPPAITTPPQSQSVAAGGTVTLTVAATGTPNLGYAWRSNSSFLALRTNTTLTLTNFQFAAEAGYDVVVTNALGAVTSAVARLYLNTPLRFTNTVATTNGGLSTLLVGRAFTNYIIQAATNLGATNWTALLTNSSPVGLIVFAETNAPALSNRFFRARVQ